MKKKRNTILGAFILTIILIVSAGTYLTPTAKAIDDSIQGNSVNDNLELSEKGVLPGSDSSGGSSSANDDTKKTLEEEKEELKKEFGITDKKSSSKNTNKEVKEDPEMNRYLESFEIIRQNYLEIENEIKRLEKMKEELDMKNDEIKETNNQIYLLRHELLGMKEEAKVEEPSFFKNTFTLVNLGIFALMILYTKGRKQVDIHRDKYYYFGKRKKHLHRRKQY